MEELERKIIEYARKNWACKLTWTTPTGRHYALYAESNEDIQIIVHEDDNELVSISQRGVATINPRDIERIMNVFTLYRKQAKPENPLNTLEGKREVSTFI